MGIPNITYWELRSDGNDNNSGGFDPISSYFSTNLTATNATTSTPTISSASYNFVSADIGRWRSLAQWLVPNFIYFWSKCSNKCISRKFYTS